MCLYNITTNESQDTEGNLPILGMVMHCPWEVAVSQSVQPNLDLNLGMATLSGNPWWAEQGEVRNNRSMTNA